MSDLQTVKKKTPTWYTRLEENDRKRLLEKINAPDFEWEGDALKEVQKEFPVLGKRGTELGDLFTFNAAVNGLKEREMLAPTATLVELDPTQPGNVRAAAEQKRQEVLQDDYIHYPSFLAKDPQIKDNYHQFVHYCLRRRREGVTLRNLRLDVEYTAEQEKLLDPKPADFELGHLLREAAKGVTKRHMPTRRMNFLGEFPGLAFIANDPARMKRQRSALHIADCFRKKNEKTLAKLERQNKRKSRQQKELGAARLLTAAGKFEMGERLTNRSILEYLTLKEITLPRVEKPKQRDHLLLFLEELYSRRTKEDQNIAQREARAAVELTLGLKPPSKKRQGSGGARRRRARSRQVRNCVSSDESEDIPQLEPPSDSGSGESSSEDNEDNEDLWDDDEDSSELGDDDGAGGGDLFGDDGDIEYEGEDADHEMGGGDDSSDNRGPASGEPLLYPKGPWCAFAAEHPARFEIALPVRKDNYYARWEEAAKLWVTKSTNGKRAKRPVGFALGPRPPPPPKKQKRASEWIVEKILDDRHVEGKREFLVKWQDWEGENTWVPLANFVDSFMVEQYDQQHNQQRQAVVTPSLASPSLDDHEPEPKLEPKPAPKPDPKPAVEPAVEEEAGNSAARPGPRWEIVEVPSTEPANKLGPDWLEWEAARLQAENPNWDLYKCYEKAQVTQSLLPQPKRKR